MLVRWPNAGNAVSTDLHFTLLGNLICLPLFVLQWYFSVLVLLGLSACFSWQASVSWSCLFRATMKLRNDVVYRPLVHSISIRHLSTDNMNSLLWMNIDMHTGG